MSVPQSCLTLRQAPLYVGFSRQVYWSARPFLSPADLPTPGIEPRSPALQADSLQSEPPERQRTLIPYAGPVLQEWGGGGGGGQGGVWGGGGKKAFQLSHPMKLGAFVSIALIFLLKPFSNPLVWC